VQPLLATTTIVGCATVAKPAALASTALLARHNRHKLNHSAGGNRAGCCFSSTAAASAELAQQGHYLPGPCCHARWNSRMRQALSRQCGCRALLVSADYSYQHSDVIRLAPRVHHVKCLCCRPTVGRHPVLVNAVVKRNLAAYGQQQQQQHCFEYSTDAQKKVASITNCIQQNQGNRCSATTPCSLPVGWAHPFGECYAHPGSAHPGAGVGLG